MREVKKTVIAGMSHQTICSFNHNSVEDDLPPPPSRAARQRISRLTLMSPLSFFPQEPRGGRPRLLLPGPAAVGAGRRLHRAGDGAAVPPLHLERLFAQIAVRVHAPAADRRGLSLLQHHGAKPQSQ